jgi:DNA-3-methyladenine glycosylase I
VGEVALVSQTELLHHAPRSEIVDPGEGDHALKARGGRSCQRMTPELGSDAPAPQLPSDRPADLNLTAAGDQVVLGDHAPDALPIPEGKRHPEAVCGPVRELAHDHRLAFRPGISPRLVCGAKPRGHLGVAQQLQERAGVIGHHGPYLKHAVTVSLGQAVQRWRAVSPRGRAPAPAPGTQHPGTQHPGTQHPGTRTTNPVTTPFIGPDGQPRCAWAGAAPEFLHYHDHEWGYPVADDRRLFEKLSLEGFQSGLSWRTILAKRESFRAAFKQFDYEKVARFTEADVQLLLGDAGIVRHRGKIEAVINNARRALELVQQEGSLAAYVWRYEPDPSTLGSPLTVSTSAASVAMSKDLKKRGWRFVGPTTAYAFMQAMGLVNDHAEDCVVRAEVAAARRAFERP